MKIVDEVLGFVIEESVFGERVEGLVGGSEMLDVIVGG